MVWRKKNYSKTSQARKNWTDTPSQDSLRGNGCWCSSASSYRGITAGSPLGSACWTAEGPPSFLTYWRHLAVLTSSDSWRMWWRKNWWLAWNVPSACRANAEGDIGIMYLRAWDRAGLLFPSLVFYGRATSSCCTARSLLVRPFSRRPPYCWF